MEGGRDHAQPRREVNENGRDSEIRAKQDKPRAKVRSCAVCLGATLRARGALYTRSSSYLLDSPKDVSATI